MGYRIKVKQIEGDIGGNPLYQSQVDDAVSSTAIGGAPSQTAQVWKTYTLSEVFDALLFPYQSPTMSLTVSGDSSLEVGQSLENPITLIWNSTNDANVQGSSITISDITSGITILSGGGSDGSTTYTYGTAVVKNSPGSHTWRAQGTNTNSQTYQGSVTKNWYWRKYWGNSSDASPTEATIEGLANSSLSNSNSGTYTISGTGYKYFAFPSVNGIPTSFILSNGFSLALADATEGFNLSVGLITYKQVSVTNAYSQTTTYNVFRSANELPAITVTIS